MRSAPIRPTDLCFCGTGKLFKHCCQNLSKLPKNPSPELKRRYWRKTVGDAMNMVTKFVEEIGGFENYMDEALGEFSDDQHLDLVLQLVGEDGPLSDCFYTWMLFHFYIDLKDELEFEQEPGFFGEDDELQYLPLAVIAMAANDVRPESDREIACGQVLSAPFSFYKVVSVQPGESVIFLDLFLDSEVTVLDLNASRSLAPGMIIYGQILKFDDLAILFGSAQIPLPPTALELVLQLKESFIGALKSKEVLIKDHIRSAEDHIRNLYLAMISSIVNPRPPTLANTDGDLMEPRTLSYSHNFSDLMELVNKLELLLRKSKDLPPHEVIKVGSSAKPVEVMVPWVVSGGKKSPLDTVLIARFFVTEKGMNVSVNSKKRATKAKKMLKDKFAGELTFIKEVEEEISIDHSASNAAGPFDERDLPPEIREALAEKMRSLQEKWLNTPIPALRGMTPRAASKDPRGRELLEALLDEFDLKSKNAAAQGAFGYDVLELRARLGMAKLN